MRSFFLLTAILLTVTGCAASYTPTPVNIPGYWHKEGVSKQDAKTKYEHCLYQVGTNSKVTPEREKRMITACMQGSGFRWIPPRTVYR